MQNVQISDANGEWFKNIGQFQFHDPESGTSFVPQLPTRATPTAWLEAMSAIIIKVEDPTSGEKPETSEAPETPEVPEGPVDPMAEAEAKVVVKDVTELTIPTLAGGSSKKNR